VPTQGSVHEDVADLAAIIERAGAPAHVLGNSMGASVSLRLAAARPELLRTLSVHEPPLFDILRDDPKTNPLAEELDARILPVINDLAAGNMGIVRFIEMILGDGAWDNFIPYEAKRTLINNAPTFLDETRDPETLKIDTQALARFERPALLTGGSESPPFFAPVLDKLAAVLPNATRKTLPGDGHLPHITHPQEYVALITEFVNAAS